MQRNLLIFALILIPAVLLFFAVVYPVALVPPLQNYTCWLHQVGVLIWITLYRYTSRHFFPKHQLRGGSFMMLVFMIVWPTSLYLIMRNLPTPDLFGGSTSCSESTLPNNRIQYECHNEGIDITGESRWCCHVILQGRKGWLFVRVVEVGFGDE